MPPQDNPLQLQNTPSMIPTQQGMLVQPAAIAPPTVQEQKPLREKKNWWKVVAIALVLFNAAFFSLQYMGMQNFSMVMSSIPGEQINKYLKSVGLPGLSAVPASTTTTSAEETALPMDAAVSLETQSASSTQTESLSPAAVSGARPTTQTPTKSGTPSTPTSVAEGAFSVKKVPTGFSMSMTEARKIFDFSVTTGKRPEDPKTLQLCTTLIDAKTNTSVSETDCVSLEKYGVWALMLSADFSLSPDEKRIDYWSPGHHPTKLRVDLVKFGFGGGTSLKGETLASDDTGTFDFVYPEGGF